MSAATKHAVKKNLQELVPLNELSASSFKEIAPKILIEEIRSGNYLFRKGDHDNQSVYLLDGKIDLIDGRKKVTGEVAAGTDISRYPVANQQPRALSARAASKVLIARIDSMLLDAYLNWDHASVPEATEIVADDDEDWMTRILKSEAFAKIPPAILQRLIISMQPFPVSAGDVVIRQGEEGDFFYSIHKGRCAVTRRDSPDGKDVLLSELSSGDFFGEESLLLASRRNASITMLTDGLLMRLGKKDFVELLQKPLVKSLRYEEACSMVDAGAVWIDVRTEEEYASDAIEDSVNIPLNELRDQIPELVFNAKYVICCDTGHRSISAAFVLSHKGFEAYVLKGGLNALKLERGARTHEGGSGVAGGSEGSKREGAEIFTLEPSRQAEVRGSDVAGSETRLPGDSSKAPGAEQLVELETLRAEIASLRRADRLRQENKGRLLELQTEIARQQDVIEESGRLVEESRAALETASREKRLLQERHDAMLASSVERIDRLEGELEQSAALVSRLQADIAAVEQDRQQLRELMGSAEVDRDARLARLEDELTRLRRQRDELQEQLETGRKHEARLEEEYASYRNDQIRMQENLQGELADARRRFESLHVELLQKSQQHSESETSLQQQMRTVESARKELDESRRQLATLEAELAAERERQQALDGGARSELESLRGELARIRQHESELAGNIAAGENESRTARQKVEELSLRYEQLQTETGRRIEQLQEQLEQSRGEKQALDERLASLQLEHESLRGEREQLLLRQEEQAGLAERLTADKHAAENANVRLQDEWNAERAALKGEIEAASRRVAELESRLEQSIEAGLREKQQLQEEMQSQRDTYREELESREREREELQKEENHAREKLRALTAERDGLQTRLDQVMQDGEAQQRKIEELNTILESLRNAAEGHSRELGAQLESVRHKADEAESELEALRMELSSRREREAGQLVDIEALQLQGEELREQLKAAEERYRARDLENQDALSKLYDDLTRKNDTERDLQGQIERLRKKLDQSEEALQAERHEARESVENIRNELNAERRARAEERAEMAARQRELKQQLVSVASQHEEVIATRDGVLAQARNDAREEERTRLGQVIAMQTQMEQQLAALQDELRQAHEETEEAVRRERASNEADLELARRQKSDADAALGQLETQLKQLMEERDAALAERQSVREQLNSLRAEVEVARGLVNADKQGLAGDPIRLISELKETRRNIEIAVRLRTEAENQRDQVLAELAGLRRTQAGAESLEVGSAADEDPGPVSAKQFPPQPAMAGQGDPGAGSVPAGTGSAFPAGAKAGRSRSPRVWLGGLAVSMLAAAVFWFTTRVEIPGAPDPADAGIGAAAPATVPAVAPESVPPAVRESPVPAEAFAGVTPHAIAAPSSAPVQASAPVSAAGEPAATRLEAGPSFRDALAGGGSGPLMVELPAATYLMGSAGNSLNFEERPQHPVELHAFAIGKYEVTFAEYDRFAQATSRRLPQDEGWGRDDRPVINVSWQDAVAYASWLSEQTGHHYRLPSESEWEFAARGDTSSTYWWEGVMEKNPANCFDCGSRWDGTRTAPVGSFQANSFGIHDTSGNVEEWTGDCYHPNYQNAPSDGSAWQSPGCTQRVVRGGSYTSPLDSVRSAKRAQYEQGTRLDNLGFRVVRMD
jgi:formylglycine-generating enzyme required for sulfatase activity/CRP-like cAMP-binding protein/rhodanese-related sulfurtransferase/chromosome segregation ATPase